MSDRRDEKINLFQLHREAYVQPKEPRLVELKPASYLAVDGTGDPQGPGFEAAVSSLYAMAYTLKFTAKERGRDFVVCKLECLWLLDDPGLTMDDVPKEQWSWTLLVRMPDFVTDDDLPHAREELKAKGKEGSFESVELRTLEQGRCVQLLHTGPYEREGESIARMRGFLAEHGLRPGPFHHEIYLSDPRRVPPEKLRTILRQPALPA